MLSGKVFLSEFSSLLRNTFLKVLPGRGVLAWGVAGYVKSEIPVKCLRLLGDEKQQGEVV